MAAVNIISILKVNGLRLTGGRKEIFEILLNESIALSRTEIERKLSNRLDRITTYRTLVSFREKGLIHAIVDPQSGVSKYSINKPGLPHYHAHFKCNDCNALICLPLDAQSAALITVPAGYSAHSVSFVVEGTCNQCKK